MQMQMQNKMNMTKWLVCLAACVFVMTLVGCQPKVPSPYTGQPVTGDQLVAEAKSEELKAIREANKKADELKKQIRTQTREAGANVEDLQQELAQVSTDLEDRLAQIDEVTTAGIAAIEAEKAKWTGLAKFATSIPGVQQAIGGTGIDPMALLTLALGGGVVWQSRRAKQREDEAWEEATRRAETEAAKRDAVWDEATNRAMLLLTKPPA